MDEYRRDLPLTVHQVVSEEYLVHTEKAYSSIVKHTERLFSA